jgi:RHS repeat-associated protein
VYDSTDTVVQSGRTYTYDDVGNRLSMVEDSGPTSNYHYDAASYRLLSVDVGGTTTEQLTYKPNGRGQVDTYTKSGSAVTYSYDMEGRVTAIDTPTVDSSFVLSADGRRVRKTVAGVATDIVYDGLNTLKEYPQSAAPVTYVADSRLDSQFLRTDGSTKTYYLRDLQTGSVIQAVSTSGAVTGEQIFRAFGEPHESNGDAGPFGFAGRYGETGASSADFRERQYAPSLGRFLAVDPLRPDAIHGLPIGGPARFALAASGVQRESVPTGAVLDTAGYLFAGNNPVSFFDPTGEPIPVIIGAVLLGLWLGGELDAFLDNLGLYFDCSISKSELIRRTGKQITWSIAGFMIGAAIGEAVAATVRWARELFQAERGASGLVGDAASGARGLSRDTVEGARYGEYWEKLKGRAPERSSPYDVVRRYDANGNISGATTYDRFGNRAYQYEFDAGARHGPGFHTYDNSGPSGGFGKGPRSPHQTW